MQKKAYENPAFFPKKLLKSMTFSSFSSEPHNSFWMMILCGLFLSPMIFKPSLKWHVRHNIDSIYKNTKKNYKNHSEHKGFKRENNFKEKIIEIDIGGRPFSSFSSRTWKKASKIQFFQHIYQKLWVFQVFQHFSCFSSKWTTLQWNNHFH